MKGASNIDNGITIDLVKLNSIKPSYDKKIVALGAGLKWGQVYEELAKLGIQVNGARGSDVGVGGFTTGGESRSQTTVQSILSNHSSKAASLISPTSTAGAATMSPISKSSLHPDKSSMQTPPATQIYTKPYEVAVPTLES